MAKTKMSPELAERLSEDALNIMMEGSAVTALSAHHKACKDLLLNTGDEYDEAAAGYAVMKLMVVAVANLNLNAGPDATKAVLKDLQEVVDFLPSEIDKDNNAFS